MATQGSRTSQALISLREQFPGGGEEVLAKFNPSMQVAYCRDAERCHFGKAPTVALMRGAWGLAVADAWMEVQLHNLSEFAGCKDKLGVPQIKELALMMVEAYPHFKLTEFMLFFQRFKACRYGRFYGAVDPMIIMQALEKFNEERLQAWAERDLKESQERREREQQGLEALKERYRARVPAAFTPQAPVTFTQYRLMGFDAMDDDRLMDELLALATGEKKLTSVAAAILHNAQESMKEKC